MLLSLYKGRSSRDRVRFFYLLCWVTFGDRGMNSDLKFRSCLFYQFMCSKANFGYAFTNLIHVQDGRRCGR